MSAQFTFREVWTMRLNIAFTLKKTASEGHLTRFLCNCWTSTYPR